MAILASADAHYDLAEWDQAIADYQAYLASEPPDPTLRGLATEALGAAFENKGDVENARLTYEKLGSDVPENALLPDRRLYHLGRLAGRTGDAAKAREYYNKLKTDFPASPLVVEVNTRLTLLDNPGLLAAAPWPATPPAPPTPGPAAPPATAAPAPAPGVPPASAAPVPPASAAPAAPAPAPGAAG
jgi:tetratricopeptide (TPR) repeat protein